MNAIFYSIEINISPPPKKNQIFWLFVFPGAFRFRSQLVKCQIFCEVMISNYLFMTHSNLPLGLPLGFWIRARSAEILVHEPPSPHTNTTFPVPRGGNCLYGFALYCQTAP